MFLKKSYSEQSPIIQKLTPIYEKLIDARNTASNNLETKFGLQNNIQITAKSIVYLFSPEIDLLDNVQSDLHHQEKFEKTMLILRALVDQIYGGKMTFEEQAAKASEEILRMSQQIEKLNSLFRQLERQNQQKDEEIVQLKNRILVLVQAYEQSKACYQGQILEYKSQIESLKKANAQKQVEAQNSKSRASALQKTHKPPSNSNDKILVSYLQNKGNAHISKEGLTSIQNTKEIHTWICLNHKATSDQLLYEKDLAENKFQKLKQEMSKIKAENEAHCNRLQKQTSELKTVIEKLYSELSVKSCKLAEKNQTINELLNIINSS